LACAREDGPRWRVGGPDDVVATIEYDVDVRRMEETVLDAHLASKVRDGYVGLLGVGVFAYLEGAERLPVILDVEGPDGWPVLTTLAPETFGPRAQRGRADDFHDLADSQIAMGPSLQVRRVEGEVPLTVAMYAEADGDLEQVATLASTALRQTIAYFGRAPFPRYTLLLEYLKPVSPRHRSGMSLEHLNGASCHLEADKAITAASAGPDKARALYNFAHHIAHAWIPKRCCGQGYFPPSWEIAPVLDSLWLSEGFVQYAAIVAISADDEDPDASRRRRVQRRFRDELATLPRFLLEMPLVELSRVASTRYGADFRTGRALYARGGLMAAEIDNTIRAATCGRKTLRDALRSLVAWSDREGKAFAIADLPGRFAEATGVDTREVFERWLGPMPVR
jgi:predicted metalloprotease with PDZ domain